MVTLIVTLGILAYVFIGIVSGRVLYTYLIKKRGWYEFEAELYALYFGLLWPAALLIQSIWMSGRGAVDKTVAFVSNILIKED